MRTILPFEYGVILNGSQTIEGYAAVFDRFEYGVILNGSQTKPLAPVGEIRFEYGVILNGSQTPPWKRNPPRKV